MKLRLSLIEAIARLFPASMENRRIIVLVFYDIAAMPSFLTFLP